MTKDLLFILIALIVSAILGYFIGRRTSSGSSQSDGGNSSNEKDLKNKISQLERDLRDCESKARNQSSASAASAKATGGGSASTASSIAAGNASTTSSGSTAVENFDKSGAKEAMGKNIKADDLKIVEGIGPKIESILKDKNISTWKLLAEADSEYIREILIDYGGDGYKIHDPTTWPKQAKMAYDGQWDKLADYQERLKGGREV